MAPFMSKIALVGCSVALLFAVCTFVVLGFLKKGSTSLRIKQHFCFCFIIINIIVLAGVRSKHQSKLSCQFATILLQYMVTAILGWVAVENYQLLSTMSKQRFELTSIKAFLIAWGFPLPFIVIGAIVGTTLNSKLRLGFYDCWKSDHVIWTLIIPCALLILMSLVCLISLMVKLNFQDVLPESKQNFSMDSRKVIIYLVYTNIILLLLFLLTWVAGFSMFWYPDEKAYQIIFGIGNTVQGLFLFFFYCIFYFEENYHLYDEHNMRKKVLADIEETSNFNLVEPCKQDIAENENNVGDEDTHGNLEEEKKELHSREEALLETNLKEADKDADSNLTETTVLVHNYGLNANETDEKPGNHERDPVTDLLTGDITTITPAVKMDSTQDQAINETEKPLTAPLTEPDRSLNERELENVDTSTTLERQTLNKINEIPATENKPKDIVDGSSTNCDHKTSSSTPPRRDTSSRSSRDHRRDHSATSRGSNVSFNSQMGMNELESLFNNPDLLSQANWKNRKKSNSPIDRKGRNPNTPESVERNKKNSTGKEDEKSPSHMTKHDSKNEFFDFS